MLNKFLITRPVTLSLSMHFSALVATVMLTMPVQADQHGSEGTIMLPIASQGGYLGGIERPKRGLNQETVKQNFGDPVSTHEPSGEPPIIRWDYENFSVYFENDVVIHTVLKHRRAD